MAKKQAKPEDVAAKAAPTSHAGKVKAIRASDNAFRFDFESKKQKHSLSLDLKQQHLVNMVIAAQIAGKKMHLTLTEAGAVSELRFGSPRKLKPAKVKLVPVAKAAVEIPTNLASASAEK